MKITLYTPDGTAETFTDCELTFSDQTECRFIGTDYQGKRRELESTETRRIDFNEAYSKQAVTEIFETSPLVQDNIPRPQ